MTTINWKTFHKCLQQIKELSDKVCDGWLLINENKEYETYLMKSETMTRNETNEMAAEELFSFEYHVVYHTSYSVPILCFNAWRTDGALVTIEDVWELSNLQTDDLKAALTQMDHPVLKMPFYTIHPCKTEMILDTVKESKNMVISWLSIFGPVVNLKINEIYKVLT